MALFLEQTEDMFGVPGSVWIEPFTIEQLQCIENGRGLFGTVLTGNGPHGVLGCLGPVVAGDEN